VKHFFCMGILLAGILLCCGCGTARISEDEIAVPGAVVEFYEIVTAKENAREFVDALVYPDEYKTTGNTEMKLIKYSAYGNAVICVIEGDIAPGNCSIDLVKGDYTDIKNLSDSFVSQASNKRIVYKESEESHITALFYSSTLFEQGEEYSLVYRDRDGNNTSVLCWKLEIKGKTLISCNAEGNNNGWVCVSPLGISAKMIMEGNIKDSRECFTVLDDKKKLVYMSEIGPGGYHNNTVIGEDFCEIEGVYTASGYPVAFVENAKYVCLMGEKYTLEEVNYSVR